MRKEYLLCYTQRVRSQPGIQLQDRDFELLRGLFESRVMTLRHIAAINFDGHKEAAKKRVQRLKDAGFIGERSRAPQEPSVLSMTRKGFEELRRRGILEQYPWLGWTETNRRIRVSDFTLQHELEVMDVKAAFHFAVRTRPDLQLAEFSTWPRLNQFNVFHPATGARVTVKPDGFIRLRQTQADDGKMHLFFLEVDRSTEALELLINRALSYRQYYKSGAFAARFRQPNQTYQKLPFRVLIVCKTESRRDNIAERLLTTDPPITTFACLSTLQQVLANPLAAAWVRPHHLQIGRGAMNGSTLVSEPAVPVGTSTLLAQ